MNKNIRFIDSQYHDLFRIPDGGMIQVEYPDRSFAARCEYMDDYHLRVGGEVFHICQFAEILERGGGSCQPEPVLELDRAVWDMGHKGFLAIQSCDSGWDYTFYDEKLNELDGGQLDDLEISLQEARNALAADFGWSRRTMTLIRYDEFIEKVEQNYLRTAEMSLEDDYSMIDGVINNGKKQESEERQSVLEQLKSAEKAASPELPPPAFPLDAMSRSAAIKEVVFHDETEKHTDPV